MDTSSPPTTTNDSLPGNLPSSYSFACSGWLKMYLFGVAKFLQEEKLTDNAYLLGSSGGALAAAGLTLGCDFDELKHHVLENVVPLAHENFWGAFNVRKYLSHTLDNYGQLHKYEDINAGQRLSIVYTSLPSCTSRRITTFNTEESLKSALMASCAAPPIAGLPFFRENELVIDGGLSDFQPIRDETTVTISPFYCTQADIRPSTYVPLWWAIYPPGKEQIEWIFQLGYQDALAWAKKKQYVQVQSEKQIDRIPNLDLFQTTFGRFTGYRTLESHLMDTFLICLVILLWKPLAFSLMYVELCGRACISGGRAALFGAACSLLGMLGVGGIVASIFPFVFSISVSCLMVMGVLSLFIAIAFISGGMQNAADTATADWQDCRQCLRSILSLSFFLRSIPVVGSTITIKRHEYLYRYSFVYRLLVHFV